MIDVEELRMVYRTSDGDIAALDGLDLHIPAGEIRGIVGPSGAGKSTLIRCLTGLARPTSGSVRIDGQEITTLSERELRRRRRSIGLVFQDVHLFNSRTAAENVGYPLRAAKVVRDEREERVTQLLDLVGLGDRGESYPHQLSGGQRQRIGIARALAAEPPVLLCDEPSSALDWATTRQILELIARVRDELGITVLIITHEMSVVRQVCDSVSRLERGRITESGRLIDIVSEGSTTLAAELIPLASPPVSLSHAPCRGDPVLHPRVDPGGTACAGGPGELGSDHCGHHRDDLGRVGRPVPARRPRG
ncbi:MULTISPECIES: methionine ABC transporter ATP-binding protein [Propionibacteriaceae]|nr:MULTISPECIES: ATP-binding cassette domain-containing protein [Propionibacteriaceae]MDN5964702.1 ATP-binding cassette domain-containing protein [Actinomyces sp.]MDK9344310.1 ATP-binding cassette domain-containing protein [Propionibacterium freudenreichii]MDK9349740.1 ATP-binding cassette domain-containing protein [Propionibacterium freudenreichii]MDK9628275.1 ATP-binding cassette domain-containing protein [Propionibacterium freudenreichii]MDK9653636.1 ATP-binding cassette domain-containing p